MKRTNNITFSYTECDNIEELNAGDRELLISAREAAKNAYAPYSHFKVGAAVRLESGKIVSGTNIENAAFPSGICAERSALTYASSYHPGDSPVGLAVAAITDSGLSDDPVPPCGNCRQVIIEEGPLAAWLLEICTTNGEHLIISDPKHNHWIGASGEKEDALDAEKLAQLARGGYIKEIHHPLGQRRRFRELITAYHDTNKSIVRVKNKIKAKFLQNGIQCPGKTVYLSKHRIEWRKKLPQEPALLVIIDSLWQQLDQIQDNLETILAETKLQAKRYPEIALIDEIPGIGFIIAATIVAILENPHRFANKRKVWAYAGLGISRKSSANKTYSEKLGKEYNRTLKCVVEEAAQVAI
ncbi:MAG: cytidine deaminase, partial [Bacteroidales bacterium]|nr:cytidine deaminase [Bacteroidales bacterium]